MVTPNPRGHDRESGRCSTTSRPKSDAVTPPVTVQRLRRNAGVTAQPSAATPFQPVRSRQAIASLMNRPTASAARGGPRGEGNGNYKYGLWTRAAVEMRRTMRARLRAVRAYLDAGRGKGQDQT
jgi:hypothetical protein